MKCETIEQIGKDASLEGGRLKRFIHFFSNRFPDESESIHSYAQQWAQRFKGDPACYMDKDSMNIYFSYYEAQQ